MPFNLEKENPVWVLGTVLSILLIVVSAVNKSPDAVKSGFVLLGIMLFWRFVSWIGRN